MKKDILIRTSVVAGLIILFVAGLLIAMHFKPKKYEYYTFPGEKGISDRCEAKQKLECKIDGKMVEVYQFSEVTNE